MEQLAIHDRVKKFILAEFLPGEDPDELAGDTPLMTTGILDSLATLNLVTFLEQEFDITVQAHEADAENMNTIDLISKLVHGKL
jgi:acyl carrier protein